MFRLRHWLLETRARELLRWQPFCDLQSATPGGNESASVVIARLARPGCEQGHTSLQKTAPPAAALRRHPPLASSMQAIRRRNPRRSRRQQAPAGLNEHRVSRDDVGVIGVLAPMMTDATDR